MHIAIRVDSSSQIGAGHVMRCLNLARCFREHGHTIAFVCRDLPGNLTPFLKSLEFEVVTLHNQEPSSSQLLSSYENWIGVSWQQDAKQFCSYNLQVDIVIVDNYALDYKWQSQVQQHFNCKMVAIDDLKRRHVADVVIDQTLNCTPAAYSDSDSRCILTGTRYAMLNPKLLNYRNTVTKSSLDGFLRVLISFGASDEPNGTLRVLQTLVAARINFQATVLLRPSAINYQLVKEFVNRYPKFIKHFDHIDNMAEIMIEHDVAIGAAGSSCWERACIGLPSIIVPIADNQRDICDALALENIAIQIKLEQIEDKLPFAVSELIEKYDDLKFNGLKICDAKGVEQIYNKVMEAIG
ncbi:UDP-2,4-diacetamido-2,4,6-trideoxy-beta-L-altropyranose hydrolase [Pseudoalteromonas spongiae]|uniref:UDP-2,4-diacetamido-2,4, 6-trideoxy-beta-L-altropyranose hydrolase n=1 Tax=Pseudoalteromonas spongiae TaxID=298657 RepID=UPI00026C99BD|nr:UDP-2,4-diacetamido-2,4,6-trideoxy-beta-L-altropyranose hydrolase [Pseudoalteromonas spongiae]